MVTSHLPTPAIAVVFGMVLLASAGLSLRRDHETHKVETKPDRIASRLRLDGSYPTADGWRPYHPRRVPLAGALMFVAGGLSGILGIGSGALKVLALDWGMGLPFKVSTTTSNFMIGVTAAASAGVYLQRGYVDPALAMPVMLGVLTGSLLGARVLARAQNRVLRWVFIAAIAVLGVEMIHDGLAGGP
jgi:uncharacterized membrane protein YfcA